MKSNMQLWSYLAQLFLEWEMFLAKVYRENKKNIYSITFISKIGSFSDNVENTADPDRPQMTI